MQTARSFVGMDVHKETISISVAEDGRNGPVRFIVRPGWFDYNKADEHHLVFLQGDGVIARSQIAEVLVHSLTSEQALRKTFELVAIKGPAHTDLDVLFAALDSDPPKTLDGVRDTSNQSLDGEPQRVKEDLSAILAT